MSWAKIIYPLQQAARCLVLVVALFALILAGAFAAERAMEPPTPAVPAVQGDTGLDELGMTPGSEEPTDGMAPGGRPCTEPSAYIQAAVVPSGSDSQPKLRLPQVSGVVFDGARRSHNPCQQDRFGTVAEVSGLLAHRFTLVGARPSGTS